MFFFSSSSFETWSCFVSQAGLNHEAIFLFQFPKCQDYRCLSPGPSLCGHPCVVSMPQSAHMGVCGGQQVTSGDSPHCLYCLTQGLCAPLHKPGQPSRVFRNATVPSSRPPQEGMQGWQMPTVISFTQIWRSECRPSCSHPSPWPKGIVLKQFLSGLTQVVMW